MLQHDESQSLIDVMLKHNLRNLRIRDHDCPGNHSRIAAPIRLPYLPQHNMKDLLGN